MFYLIHGDDIVASRNKLQELAVEPTIWLNNKDTLADISQAIASQDLFENHKVIVIENILAFLAKSRDEIITMISDIDDKSMNIILWQDEILDKKFLQKFKNVKVLEYSFPKYFYQFLDALAPKRGKNLLEIILKMNAISDEQLFYAIVKRVRFLVMIKTKKLDEFEDFKKMQNWQLQKLARQSAFWQEDELVKFYKALFELELKLKTSELPLSIRKHLDILIARAL